MKCLHCTYSHLYFLLYVTILTLPETFAAPNAGTYYSTNGGITDNCRVSNCDYSTNKCEKGKYLSGCGGTSEGICLSCVGPPTNAGSNAAWSSNGGNSGTSTSCQWTCNTGYGKDSTGTSCIVNTCTGQGISVANSEFTTTDYQSCTYQCSAGYFGVTPEGAKGPVSCNECTQGTYTSAANAAASCTSCAAGKFSSNLHATACSSCAIDTYAPSTAMTACIPCAGVSPSCSIGMWRSGCGATSIGSCVNCGNLS